MNTIRITVTGKVYKVGYLYFVKQIADRYHISGNVRYKGNRQVVILASGKEDRLEKFLTYCRLGCLGSKIQNVSVSELHPEYSSTGYPMKIIEKL